MLAFALSRQKLAALVFVASAAVLGFLLFGDSDEERVRQTLHRLADAVGTREGEAITFRTARLNGAFKELLDKNVSLDAPELDRVQGIKDLALLAASAPRFYGSFSVDLEESEVDIAQGEKQARCTARVTLIGGPGGEVRRDRRTVRFQLTKADGDWKVFAIEVAAQTNEEPEARP